MKNDFELDEFGAEQETIDSTAQPLPINIDPLANHVSFELPNGFKITLASTKSNISELCSIALELYVQLKKEKASGGNGSYLG